MRCRAESSTPKATWNSWLFRLGSEYPKLSIERPKTNSYTIAHLHVVLQVNIQKLKRLSVGRARTFRCDLFFSGMPFRQPVNSLTSAVCKILNAPGSRRNISQFANFKSSRNCLIDVNLISKCQYIGVPIQGQPETFALVMQRHNCLLLIPLRLMYTNKQSTSHQNTSNTSCETNNIRHFYCFCPNWPWLLHTFFRSVKERGIRSSEIT